MAIKNRLFKAITPILAAISIGCGGTEVDYPYKTVEAPAQSQFYPIIESLQAKMSKGDYSDEQDFIENAVKLALIIINNEGPAVNKINLAREKGGACGVAGATGCYLHYEDVIILDENIKWIPNLEFPVHLLAHEIGHKVQFEKTPKKAAVNESVAMFYENWTNAFWNIHVNPNGDYSKGFTIEKPHYAMRGKCDALNGSCRYSAGRYIELKYFGETDGNFKKTLEELLKKSGQNVLDEYNRDIEADVACNNFRKGIDTYNQWMLRETNGGYTNNNGENVTENHFTILSGCD